MDGGAAVDLAAWEREGWFVVRALLDPRTVAALHEATDALEAMAASFEQDTSVRGTFFELQSASGRKREPALAPGLLRKITGPSKAQPPFARLHTDPRVRGLVVGLGLSDPRCVIDQVNLKAPRVGTGFPYHQDAGFLFGDARERLERSGGAHLVIALDPADAGNGGFEVLGRTHRVPREDLSDGHHYDTSTRNEGVFDERFREVPSLAPGDAVVFHPWLAHGSGPNLSDRRRRLVTMWWVGRP
ncbi:MAG: phytanoyl-CoA dioxygenase family protein [Alphaproteobacteria bacterium]|nr:phytanoyl-CoA dioxygenase family protein [Alphaproteobacteria bacterium]MCB9697310.1 phytanoyl-CoA dioxygenase family protein [Alphaproteobacteria bacterium]